VTSNDTQTKGNTPTDSNGGTVAFTTEAVEKARDIITGYEAKDLAIYISSCRSLALVVNKIDKGQRTDFKAEVAAGGEDENGEEKPAVSMSTIDAMLKVGQWVLTLTGLGVSVSAIQVLPASKRQIQNGLRQSATNKIKREDVPEVLTLDWLLEVGALVPLKESKPAGKREARPEGNDMDAPAEGTSAPMGGNETPKGSEFAEFRRLAAKFANMSGPFENQTDEEREQLAYSLGRCLTQNKAKAATV
jgi:hypothetical protein